MTIFYKKLSCFILVTGVVSTAYSQLKTNDFTKREARLSERRMTVEKKEISQNRSFGGKSYAITKRKKSAARLSRRKASLEVSEIRPKATQDKKVLKYPLKQYGKAPEDGRKAFWDKNKAGGREFRLVSKYAKSPVITWDTHRYVMDKALEELSLQDINRYSFRRNHSSESGIPVQRTQSVGSVETDESP